MKNPFRSIRLFWGETVTELKKASWPPFPELVKSTAVVLVAIALLGSFVAIADFSLYEVVTLFTELVGG